MRHCDEVKVQPQWPSRLAGRRRGPGKSTVADVVSEIEQLLGMQGPRCDRGWILHANTASTGRLYRICAEGEDWKPGARCSVSKGK